MPGDVNQLMYSIQRTYILKPVLKPGNIIITCNQRIDIPTIEPLFTMPDVFTDNATIVPCIELAGDFLAEIDLTFETNEGVTVLPITIDPSENPYLYPRYVLVLPRGTTGIKSCKIFPKGGNTEIQHNFTFGIMPPPYNYDNALFGLLSSRVVGNTKHLAAMDEEVTELNARVTALENKAGR